MAEEDQDQKTELPTGKRLGEARDRGQLPISREVSSFVSMIGVLLVIGWVGPDAMESVVFQLRSFLQSAHEYNLDNHNLQTLIFDTVVHMFLSLGLIFIVMASAIILGVMSQTGLFVSTELIKPDIMRLNPANGFKKLFSLHSGVEIIKSLCKLVLLGTVAFYTLKPLIDDMPALTGGPLMPTIAYLHHQMVHVLIMLLLVFTLVAIGDWYFTRYQYIKNLKMTKNEVKDEFRQQEGDPLIKGRLRQMRVEKARKRMMAQVPKADVVITNPTHYAIALQYDSVKMGAPRVLAKGIDHIALRIRDVAEENKITLVSNPPLARALYDTVEIDQEIPAEHYRAVAEIISYVFKLKNRHIK